MANYYGKGRTNYVKVKDEAAFREVAGKFAEVVEQDGRLALLDNNLDGSGWNFYYYGEDNDEDGEIDFVAELAPLLEDGEVMIFMEAGAEKYRYVVGWAFAFNNKGETKEVRLDDIYELAKDLGTNITGATY